MRVWTSVLFVVIFGLWPVAYAIGWGFVHDDGSSRVRAHWAAYIFLSVLAAAITSLAALTSLAAMRKFPSRKVAAGFFSYFGALAIIWGLYAAGGQYLKWKQAQDRQLGGPLSRLMTGGAHRAAKPLIDKRLNIAGVSPRS